MLTEPRGDHRRVVNLGEVRRSFAGNDDSAREDRDLSGGGWGGTDREMKLDRVPPLRGGRGGFGCIDGLGGKGGFDPSRFRDVEEVVKAVTATRLGQMLGSRVRDQENERSSQESLSRRRT